MSASTKSTFRKFLPLIIIFAFIVIAIIIMISSSKPEKKPDVFTPPLVDSHSVTLQHTSLSIDSLGTLTPKHQTSLITQVSGEIIEISPLFASGGKVKKGDFLAQIDPSDYQAALVEAQANLQRTKAELQEEEARGVVAKKEWQGATSSLPPALGLRKPQLAREQANVRSAQASLERAQRNLRRTKIVAPYNALVNARNVDLGQFASVGTNIGVVSSIDIGEIRLPISSADYAFLTDDKQNDVVLSRIENGKKYQWIANIIRDEGVIDEQSRMIHLVAQINKPYQASPQLQFGSFVNATIKTETHPNIAIIPNHLYQNGQVLLIKPDRTIHKQSVDVLKRDKTNVYIQSGLNNGDLLLNTKIENLYEGMLVRLTGDPAKTAKLTTDSGDK